ncbi:cryptochrome/photolyase family protein [Lapillicoccus jejuensis]|uniref:Deoxyribodipyrimidine photo-lyase n=1 Tax=Lapillicoccus jejuensis TaxID=402171 RepID=A0A542DYV0_9MICO|nr:deoxyribodipyrimidine photo-lyase [Lapillicoccus jejuensis]TQJ08272.1 deoxyribodipyrimidine photo-lyase [Lapillicoccus jejuensis]
MTEAPSVVWFRRDLRLRDHAALLTAAQQGPVLALFVLDDVLLRTAGGPRTAWLRRSLRALDADLREHGGGLVVRRGRPADVVPATAAEVGASAVHVSADFTPYGARRDTAVETALAGLPGSPGLVRTGSPYAVAPGRVVRGDGAPYQVFTPFYRSWLDHGWRRPAESDPAATTWVAAPGDGIPDDPELGDGTTLPEPGEAGAAAAWARFREEGLAGYDTDRDRPDHDATSRMSPHLKIGTVHPRTLLADLGHSTGEDAYRRQLAWRDFYAAVLHFWPRSAHGYFRRAFESMEYDTGAEAQQRFRAWQEGRTGFPYVDAGMRQLLAEGWMHNRLRMLVASFLVKDLHLEWTLGARHFMDHLVDGDLANNQHGWQWAAGTGTDAAPYFRVFNPITQGEKFDPQGDYVRRWVPELRDVPGKAVHRPWDLPQHPVGYPHPLVDHAEERREALRRLSAVQS